MKTAISIPDPLFRSSERAAKKMRISRSRFYSNAVSHYLHDIEKSDVTQRLNEIYKVPVQEDSRVPAMLEKLQLNVLRKDA
jgi:metal-responsive CopG/Arc/MetJ family transcriptional regulator